MTADAFDRAFGSVNSNSMGAPSFVEKLGRTGARPEEPAMEAAVGQGQYKAYGYLPTNTIGETCDIQRWMDGTEIPEGIEFQYRFLVQIAYTGEEEIRLYLPDSIVVITGSNLRELRKKLGRRQVTFIQQFSAKVWPGPQPVGETRIDRIEVLRP